MTPPTVVRFDAELLIHRAPSALTCNGAVIVTERLTGWNGGDHGSIRRVLRCILRNGHHGEHSRTYDDGSGPSDGRPTTECGLPLTDGAWINWTASEDDPRCPSCFDVAVDQQEALL